MKNILLILFTMVTFFCSGQAPDKMLEVVNTSRDEQLPVLSPDHRVMYFTRANDPENVGGKRDPGDIWYCELQPSGEWSAPRNARELNNAGYNAVLGFTVDSRTIYLHNHYNRDNSPASTQGISRAVMSNGRWGSPENMNIPYFLNKSTNQSGFISMDGQVLLLSIQGYGTVGAEDIYVCFNEGGKWSEPLNLGRTVNSPAQEFTPYLSGDKQTLYFSSNGKGGEGSSDIFRVQRLDDTWQSWSAPEPVEGVNSQGRDLGYREYDGFSLYTSTINSDGFSDIRFYSPKEKPIEPVAVEIPDSLQVVETITPPGDDMLYGTLKNSTNRQAVTSANIQLLHEGNRETVAMEEGGTFRYKLTGPGTYILRIDAPGYISMSDQLVITADNELGLERNYLLDPIEVGRTVQLHNVLFQRSTPNILPDSFQELDMVVDFMKANPSVRIRLEGHTDNTGVPKHNLRLSQARVESVEEYLVDHGIDHRRISGKGYGGTRPIADNSNEETRKLNRRVEFTIVKN